MAEQNKNKKPTFKGEILLCEDNELMQSIIKSHLMDIGFEVALADNGKECVDIVSARMKNNESPFGLIFMDIYMPVMDGMEAADTLMRIGNKTPIAALTASADSNDIEKYKAHHIENSLKKPVIPEELWSFLCKYFTPLGFGTESKNDDEDEKRVRLLTGFVKRNKTTFADISNAINAGDIKLAHRLAHTVKGLAGLMGKAELQEVSRVLEYSLAEGIMEHIDDQMAAFGQELTSVLDELSPLLEEPKTQSPVNLSFDKAKAEALFEKLEQLLLADNAKCRELTKDLKEIPGTAELIEQIEDYEFERALELLVALKGSLKRGGI